MTCPYTPGAKGTAGFDFPRSHTPSQQNRPGFGLRERLSAALAPHSLRPIRLASTQSIGGSIRTEKRRQSHPDQPTDRQLNWERKRRLIGSGSERESGEESGAKATGIAVRIGGSFPPQSAAHRQAKTARAAPQTGPALAMRLAAKERTHSGPPARPGTGLLALGFTRFQTTLHATLKRNRQAP